MNRYNVVGIAPYNITRTANQLTVTLTLQSSDVAPFKVKCDASLLHSNPNIMIQHGPLSPIEVRWPKRQPFAVLHYTSPRSLAWPDGNCTLYYILHGVMAVRNQYKTWRDLLKRYRNSSPVACDTPEDDLAWSLAEAWRNDNVIVVPLPAAPHE